ncbi:MAG: glycoside hydrolase family 44 protein [Planctomycetota bacterium]
MRHFDWATSIAAYLCIFLSNACAIEPDNPGLGDVAFTIDASTSQPISPLIYGVNGSLRPSGVTGIRLGGNRWTGYNWETNNSNAGGDYFHVNDQFLTGAFGQTTTPGQAVSPALQEAASLGAAANLTVPMAGFVSADQNGTVTPAQTAPSSRWHEVRTRKSDIYPGSSLSTSPNLNDNYVFTDEFVNWVESNRQNNQQVNYLLDNEPGLWSETHPYLYGSTGATFADVGQKSIATASAIKDINPNAKVLGGVTFGWSAMQSLQSAPDFDQQVPPAGRDLKDLHFNRWLLETVAAEELQQGRVLMDALDVHWYPEARGGGVRITAGGEFNTSPAVVEARLQAPRSLWDPTYIEDSWITDGILRDYSGQGNHEGVELLNRVKDDIAEFKPGTLLSVSEYNYGGGNHISGGIAQADVLGIFGREGVWNASWWPIENESNAQYVRAGFEMYTDFDGQGGKFGDVSIAADTSSVAESSVYASRSTENADEMIVVAINRTDAPLDAAIQIADDQRYTSAEVYQLTEGAAAPVFDEQLAISLVNAFVYEMPAYSVSTIRLTAPLAGDFDGNGIVNGDDLDDWQLDFGDGLDGSDFLEWQRQLTLSSLEAASVIPEPNCLAALVVGIFLAANSGRIRI